jgi:hypothetical protein
MIPEYLVVSVTPATDPRKLTEQLNKYARRGWTLRHQVYTDVTCVQYTFERELDEERTKREIESDEAEKLRIAAEKKAERDAAHEYANSKNLGLFG